MAIRIQFGPVEVGAIPRVVGVMTRAATGLFHAPQADAGCDIVEMRLDHMGAEKAHWWNTAARLTQAGLPVLATLRMAAEGGAWHREERTRREDLFAALHHCAAVDVELQSGLIHELAAEAERQHKALVVSYHNFQHTPSLDALTEIIQRAALNAQVVVKVAVQVNSPEDMDRLRALLAAPPVSVPLCLIGMGDQAASTRLDFPQRGSCLAYGYLDEPTAPGQWSCRAMADALHATGECAHDDA